ncbi:LuxR C-terminal-related transcriptional regulator [Paraburkholderia dipogonis]|uniref:LuxR C-terminal-related transcriptional regulator n=1 Tax=Paraburkholderia dipogonis TaxID=1211383 RepID=UPI0038BC4515
MNIDKLLVVSKFAPPRIDARHIFRTQLLDPLREPQHYALALVTGGAGFGKTILLVQRRQELMKAGAEVAWLSLSHDDKHLPNFCAYLFAAFERLGIRIENDMLLEGDSGKSMNSVLAVVADAVAHIAKELYLIIDDYHHVEDPWAHKLMQKLLDHCPANLHLIIASRVTPPLGLSRLRVSGQVAEIGFAELPFDVDETRVFFERNLSTMKLSADEVRLIHDLTNGWPASLQLIAVMLKNSPAKRAKLRSFLRKSTDLQAYLAEDVLAYLPPESTAFLETISVCRRFNAELAAFIADNAHAADLIKRAEDENLLIYRVESDDPSPWYRFHPLFGDFLASRLTRRGQPAVEALHRLASRWFAGQELLAEAVHHASLGGDLEFAVDAIEQATPTTWSLGYISPMLHLLEHLPQDTLFAHPRLFFLGCLTYALTARPDQAEQWIEQIRKSDAAKNPAISSQLALADAAIALQRDDTQRVIDLLKHNAPSDIRFLRYVYWLSALAAAYASVGRYSDARKLLADNPVDAADCDNDMALVAEGTRPLILLIEGNVKEAARLGAPLLARSEAAHGRGSLSANLCAGSLGDAYYELDRLDEARAVLANRTSILRFSSPEVMVHATLCHARLDLLQETPDVALEFLEAHATHFNSIGLDRPLAYMLAEQIRILLIKGDRVRAADLTADLHQLAALHRNAKGFRAEIPVIAAQAQARLALANCDYGEALDALLAVVNFAEKFGRARLLVMANVLAATALSSLERKEEAAQYLIHALQTGARLGLIRTFLDEGQRVGEMLAHLQNDAGMDSLAAQWLHNLMGRFSPRGPAEQTTSASSYQKKTMLQEVILTPRELEILGLVSQAMSTKRIALTLNLTPETVKWNVRNILSKLNISSRYDGVTWARQRGLIK